MKSIGLALGMIAALAMGACGNDDKDDDMGTPDSGGSVMVDAGGQGEVDATVPQPDAMPALTGIDAMCAEDGPFATLFEKFGSCNPFLAQLEVQGTGLLSGPALSQVCLDSLGPQVADPTVSVDDSLIAACLTYINDTTCEEIDIDNFDATPCAAVLVGTVATDGACDVAAQCAGDAYCESSDALCGTCQDRVAVGLDCTADQECSSGYCNAAQECAVQASAGAACVTSADCAGQLSCSEGSVCELLTAFDPTGMDCDNCGDPFSGYYCEAGETCQPLPALGETCGDFSGLNQGMCNFLAYEWCEPGSNTCVAPAVSADGQACHTFAVIGSGARKCAEGLMCPNPLGGVFGEDITNCTPAGFSGDDCDTDVGEGPGTQLCHPLYFCNQGSCENDDEFTGQCPAP